MNTETPKGGVIKPISVAIVRTTPNQIISTLFATRIGAIIGRISMKMDEESKMQPIRTTITMTMIKKIKCEEPATNGLFHLYIRRNSKSCF